jgi:hypothetical protein
MEEDMDVINETGCCPRFNPEPWDGKQIAWQGKPFIRDRVRSVLHIPLNFGAVMRRNLKVLKDADAFSDRMIVLSDENSLWGADVYIESLKPVSGANMAYISGTFLSKVFEGPYQDVHKWVLEMKRFVASEGREMKKMYFYYTTCPKCAKHYGKNYVVILAQIG